MTRSHYLTARCWSGCETWLHPAAIEAHIDFDRCRGHPWVDDVVDATLIAASVAEALIPLLPPELIGHPSFSEDRRLRGLPDHLHDDVYQGITVRSPIVGIPSRRWLHVATAVANHRGEAGIQRATTATGFEELEREFIDPTEFVECLDCRELVKSRGLRAHRSRNSVCRWRRAAAEVRTLWAGGFRDPYRVAGAPLKWSDLRATSEWRRRLRTVEFPKWAAVLLAPPAESDPACQATERPSR